MGCIEYESYYLKEAEWKLLLAGIGITAWYGLDSGGTETEKMKEDVHRILAGLYQKEVIDWENGSVVIRQPFAAMFDSLRKSRFCITIRRWKSGDPVRCCYIGETDVIVTEKSQREEEAICLFLLAKNAFLLFALENPEVSEGIFGGSGEEEFASGEDVVSFQLRNCRSGEMKCELILQESGLQTFLVVKKEDTVWAPYRLAELKVCLRRWLYGGENDDGR